MEKLRIVFMGTPGFAVGILDTIIQAGYEVAAVITATDKPAGRGQKVQYSAVKEYAMEHNLKLLQPTSLKDEAFLDDLKALKANLQVVVAFRMLPEAVWRMPEYGTFNLHASLLPDYRGAAPINWAIINGETETGVTTFFIDDKIDTGAMILSKKLNIGPEENAGSLHDRLMELGSMAVTETLELIAKGEAATTVQSETADQKTAYKLNRENCRIDWTQSGKKIHNLIRGLSPYPAAWTLIQDEGNDWNVKVYEAAFEAAAHGEPAGKLTADKKTVRVAVQDGYISLLEIQFPGKKKMKAHELLNGMRFSENAKAC